MSANTAQKYQGVWLVVAAIVVVGGIAATVLFAANWLSDGKVEARAETLANEKAAAMAQQPQGPPPAAVRVTAVKQETLQQRIAVVGRLREVRRATVASQVEGRVLEVFVDTGDVLKGPVENEPGTLIAEVDDVWADLAVQQARADLAAATARIERAKQDLEHLQKLSSRGASDQQALDDASALVEVESANVQARQAALNLALETVDRVDIYAPFDAKVIRKATEKGQWLEPGGAVVEIVSRGQIDAIVDVPEQYITALSIGTPIDVVVEPVSQTVTGKVVAINPDGSNPARTYPVKIRLDDVEDRFKVGMSVTALVPIKGEAEYLTVPRDAVAFSESGAQVWMSVVMPGPDGMSTDEQAKPQAMPMDVKVLFGEGERFAVRPMPKMKGVNLAEGTEIVVEGKESLWPTRPLAIVAPGQPMEGGSGEPTEPSSNAAAAAEPATPAPTEPATE